MLEDRTSTSKLAAVAGIVVTGALVSCLIPDRDIIVVSVNPCGEKWTAHTSGAYGYDVFGKQRYILDAEDHPIAKTYCFNPAQADDMRDATSDLYADVVIDIIHVCRDRAQELALLDTHDSCAMLADAAYVEPCQKDYTDCEAGETGTGDETGAQDETGADGVGGLAALDLDVEVVFDGVEYAVSQRLIDAALTDAAGLLADGTRATLVEDADGLAYGFEIRGVEPGNLGYALGLRDEDVITEIAGLPTASYEDLFALAEVLTSASSVELSVARGSKTVTLRYHRVASGG